MLAEYSNLEILIFWVYALNQPRSPGKIAFILKPEQKSPTKVSIIIDGHNLAFYLYNLRHGQRLNQTIAQTLVNQLSAYQKSFITVIPEIELCFDGGVRPPEPDPSMVRVLAAGPHNKADYLILDRFRFHSFAGRPSLVITNDAEIQEKIEQEDGRFLNVFDFVLLPHPTHPVFLPPKNLPFNNPGKFKKSKQDFALNEKGTQLVDAISEIGRLKPSQKIHLPPKPVSKPIPEPLLAPEQDDTPHSSEYLAAESSQRVDPPLKYVLTISSWPLDAGVRFLLNSFCSTHRPQFIDMLESFERSQLRPQDLVVLAEFLRVTCSTEPEFTHRGSLMDRVRLALLKADETGLDLDTLAIEIDGKPEGLQGRIKRKANGWLSVKSPSEIKLNPRNFLVFFLNGFWGHRYNNEMDFSHFADLTIIDGHIHFSHPVLAGSLQRLVQEMRFARINLVATPDQTLGNHNPALIHYKMHHPHSTTICGAMDYLSALADPQKAPQALADQVKALHLAGFDGIKILEGKPMVRKLLGIPLDSPFYEGMWAAIEDLGMPVVWHVADPEEFWDPVRCPDWARNSGWYYGDGSFPTLEDLYGEVDHILSRHPGLKVVLAHFYFLSSHLKRAGEFLQEHPNAFFDLTPGSEMFFDFSRNLDASREFFLAFSDRLLFGTDIGASAILQIPAGGLEREESLGRAWVVRQFLESSRDFSLPRGVAHWEREGEKLVGIGLPEKDLKQIYAGNFERLFGTNPAGLNQAAAVNYLEQLATAIDQSAGKKVESPSRQVAFEIKTQQNSLS